MKSRCPQTSDPFEATPEERALSDATRRKLLQFAHRLHELGCELEAECREFEDWCKEEFSWMLNNLSEEDAGNFVGNVPGYLRTAGRLITDMVNHPLLRELDAR
jgi:hypothetical protein